MLKDDVLIGAISIYRQEARPFAEKQIALVQNFAAQAVIAIENARLLNELRRSLEQQTATANVLRVISSSPNDLRPVFDALAENAARLCDGLDAYILLREGNMARYVANYGDSIPMRGIGARPLTRGFVIGRAILESRLVHILDLQAESEEFPEGSATARQNGYRTIVAVPLLREGLAIGAIAVRRVEARLFSDKQLELLSNFAAQAVIAIENTRLLNELRESLDRQTATSEVLEIISSSPGELEPVFQKILANAVRICGAKFGGLFKIENEIFSPLALFDTPQALVEFNRQRGSYRPETGVSFDRLLRTKDVVQTADAMAEPVPNAAARFGGARSYIAVPMLKDNNLIGAISIYHQHVRPFTDKQIELVKNFAAQAVIAIENARLLTELRQRTADLSESLERQTATADVLRIISSSPGELKPVFDMILDNAVKLCEASMGDVFRVEGNLAHIVGTMGALPEYAAFRRDQRPYAPAPDTPLSDAIRSREPVHVSDMRELPGYAARLPNITAAIELNKVRTQLVVPMIRDEEVIGVIMIFRREVRRFEQAHVELVKNFATQAVIAIENARLLDDLNGLNQQLEQRVADQVGEIERMGRLRRFLPPQVADLIVASGTEKQLESHRREITALFCDLRGFTGFSESSDPEDVMALLREYHAAIGRIIIKYSGTLERYAGDGVMVIFNDPVPVENPALQAVLMALDMRSSIEALMEKWRLLGHDIGFGIGIAHGYATLGTIGFESRYDYAAIGTVSNVASRLCDEAKPGQILISPRVLLAVDKAITVEPVGEFALKGIRRAMQAYNVLSNSPPGAGEMISADFRS
jgi:GAF domain-containing protein